MSKTNCINCGAAKDTSEIKCPFCGTTYLDMTAIDFASGEPVVCQFVLPGMFRDQNGSKMVMSMLARPKLEELTSRANTVSVSGGRGGGDVMSFVIGYDINIGVSFTPVERKNNGSLFELTAVEEA